MVAGQTGDYGQTVQPLVVEEVEGEQEVVQTQDHLMVVHSV